MFKCVFSLSSTLLTQQQTIRAAIQNLEQDIQIIESSLLCNNNPDKTTLYNKRQELAVLLQEKFKGAMSRARFVSLKDMDAPSSFFFNLEKYVSLRKQMACLRLPDGRITTPQARSTFL